jgi:acyl homoserine lactone synthase
LFETPADVTGRFFPMRPTSFHHVGFYNYNPVLICADFLASNREGKFMHIIAISKPQSIQEAELLQRHHRLRAEVFSDRLGWDVDVVDGCEKDAFDQEGPAYILAIATTGEVAGCARLLPAIGPTMIADVFGSLLPDGRLNAHPAMVESSRFCVDTRLSGGRGTGSLHEATLSMFAGIIEWSIENGFTEIVTVTDLRFERILARVGWSLRRIGEPKTIGVTTAVAGSLQADTEMLSRLRPAGYSSQIGSRLTRAA